METKIQEFKLKDGTIINIEAIDDENSRTRVNKNDKVIENFEDSISAIKPVSEALLATLKDLNTPDEIKLNFGVSMSSEAGVIFASAEVKATFNISITWKNK